MWLRVGAAAALLTTSVCAAPSAAVPDKPPSVVLITLDTTRADRLGCYGKTGAGTPNLDRLAASGVRFADAWSAAPITLPSHLTMMTGCTPATHGVRDNGVARYDGRIPTLASRFASAGYRTLAVVSSSVLDSAWGANAGFAAYDERFDRKDERSSAAATTRALELLSGSADPFFLWVHYYDPHWTYDPPKPFAERFRGDPYQGEIASMDAEVGRLLAGLTKSGRHPIVLVAGDHGEGLGEHRERTHGIFTYRSTLHVPFMISGPRIPAGRIVSGPVGLVDLAPTLAALTGLPPAAAQDGISLAEAVVHGAPAPHPRTNLFRIDAPARLLRLGAAARIHRREIRLHRAAEARGVRRSERSVAKEKAVCPDCCRPSSSGALRATIRVASSAQAPTRRRRSAKSSARSCRRSATFLQCRAPPRPRSIRKTSWTWPTGWTRPKSSTRPGVSTRRSASPTRSSAGIPRTSRRSRCAARRSLPRSGTATRSRRCRLRWRGTRRSRSPGSIWIGALAGAGETAKAETEWRKAIELDPHFPEPRASLIAAARESGGTAKAMELARQAATSGAESAELDFEIGLVHAITGDLDAAERWFESALRLRPGYAQALGNLGQIAYAKGRIDESLSRYRAASRAAPDDPEFPKHIGAILLEERNDAAGALAAFRSALAVEKDPVERQRLTAMIAELTSVSRLWRSGRAASTGFPQRTQAPGSLRPVERDHPHRRLGFFVDRRLARGVPAPVREHEAAAGGLELLLERVVAIDGDGSTRRAVLLPRREAPPGARRGGAARPSRCRPSERTTWRDPAA